MSENNNKENRKIGELKRERKIILYFGILFFTMFIIHLYLFDPGVGDIIRVVLRTIEMFLVIIFFLSIPLLMIYGFNHEKLS